MNALQISGSCSQGEAATLHALTVTPLYGSGPLKAYSQICHRESFRRQKSPVISAFSPASQWKWGIWFLSTLLKNLAEFVKGWNRTQRDLLLSQNRLTEYFNQPAIKVRKANYGVLKVNTEIQGLLVCCNQVPSTLFHSHFSTIHMNFSFCFEWQGHVLPCSPSFILDLDQLYVLTRKLLLHLDFIWKSYAANRAGFWCNTICLGNSQSFKWIRRKKVSFLCICHYT